MINFPQLFPIPDEVIDELSRDDLDLDDQIEIYNDEDTSD